MIRLNKGKHLTATFSGIKSIGLTTDGWTSRSTVGYFSITLHYADSDNVLKNFVLNMTHFPQDHTGRNIHDFLEQTLEEWGLKDDAIHVYIVTDNAKNMVNAVEKNPSWKRIPCFAHTLQLAIKDVTKKDATFESLRSKSKKIVGHFSRSTKSQQRLIETQRALWRDKTPLKLIQNVDTRWNTEHDMLKRMIELKPALCTLLCDKKMPASLDESEWTLAESYVKVLEPIKEATCIMSGTKYPTLSLYLPVTIALLQVTEINYFSDSPDQKLNKKLHERLQV